MRTSSACKQAMDFAVKSEPTLADFSSENGLGPTGVEMEALTAVQVGLLTVYDMCKAVDRAMVIGDVRLLEKHGGKSGSFVAAG